jgi:hypothetical protein
MPQRYDVGRLDKPQKTPQGGLRAQGFLTRTGVFIYDGPNGPVKEYRPPEEVFHADSLATLPGAPLTAGHPRGFVSPDNFSDHAVGHVGDEVKQDGGYVAAFVTVQDRRAIKAIESGQRELSCGYACRIDDAPGTTPTGEAYDRVQRDIRYNHVALVAKGRAGADVRLRLDASGDQTFPHEVRMDTKEQTKVERIDGVDYELGTPPHADAVKRRDAADKKRAADFDVLKARCDAAESKLADAEKKLAEATDVKRIDGMVAVRAALFERARAVLGAEAKLDGLTERQIQEQVVAKLAPKIKCEGRSDEAVATLFEAFATTERADAAATAQVRVDAHRAQTAGQVDVMADARKQMLIRQENAWRTSTPSKES